MYAFRILKTRCYGGLVCKTRQAGRAAPRYFRKVTIQQRSFTQKHDEFKWMEDLDDPRVWRYIEEENMHTESFLRPVRHFQRTIFDEIHQIAMKTHVSKSAPERNGPYLYSHKISDGDSLPVLLRAPVDHPENEEVIFDMENYFRHVEASDYVGLGMMKVSPDHELLVFTVDTTGKEHYKAYIRDLLTGQTLCFDAPTTTKENLQFSASGGIGSLALCADGVGGYLVYFSAVNAKLRPFAVGRRRLRPAAAPPPPAEEEEEEEEEEEGRRRRRRRRRRRWALLPPEPEEEQWVHAEADEAVFLDVNATKDNRYILINSNSKKSSEVRVIDTKNPDKDPVLIKPRSANKEYFVEHSQGNFLILANGEPESNLSLFTCPAHLPGAPWRRHGGEGHGEEGEGGEGGAEEDLPFAVEDLDAFRGRAVLYGRSTGDGTPWVHVVRTGGGGGGEGEEGEEGAAAATTARLELPAWAACGALRPGANPDFDASSFRFSLSSPAAPAAEFEHDFAAGTTAPIDGGGGGGGLEGAPLRLDDGGALVCEREWASAPDGARVPLTVARRADLPRDGNRPTLLIGYGAYGAPLEPEFRPEWAALLARGWVVAFAHVRGGGERGRRWHVAGRERRKRATFADFAACAERLLAGTGSEGLGWTRPGRLAAFGASAGGLVLGHAANARPDLFRTLIARVPFLDVIGNMTDPSLPLTAHEVDEWGNPADTEALEYMQSYCPYTNAASHEYPWIFISTSLNDARVQCSDSFKWKSRIQSLNTDNQNKIFIHTREEGGHMGAANDSDHFVDVAQEIAFLYKTMDLPM